MLDISFVELFLVAVVGLMVIGPKQLPDALRTLGLWLGRMRRSFTAVKSEIEREIGMDDIRRQLHNEAVLEEMKRIEAEVKSTADVAKNNLNQGIQAANATDTTANTIADPNVDGEISDMIAAQDGGVPANQAQEEARDDRDHTDAGAEPADDRDHSDAGAEPVDDRDHSDAAQQSLALDDRDHSDAGAEPEEKSQRVTGA